MYSGVHKTQMEDKKIQWHPAFCSAVRLELSDNKKDLYYFNEYNLNSKPLQIDMLIIHKPADRELTNQIGKRFRKFNIMEYKAPDDGINIDSYFKVIAYACLYKADGKQIDGRKQETITISIVQERKPKKLFQTLDAKGHTIDNPFPGIYYIHGHTVLFPTQIIVLRELDKKQHTWLTSLTESLTGQQARQLIESSNALFDKFDKTNADSILNVIIRANIETFAELRKEVPEMCEALEELMEPVIAEKLKKRTEEVTRQVTQKVTKQVTQEVTKSLSDNIAVRLLEDDIPVELVAKYTGLTRKEVTDLRADLEMT